MEGVSNNGLLPLLDNHSRIAKAQCIRIPFWMTGNYAWLQDQTHKIVTWHPPSSRIAIISDRFDSVPNAIVISPHRAERLLGQEFECVIYDAFSGVNPDALGQISGLIVGGGLFVLLSNPPEIPEFYDDPEKERLTVFPYTSLDVADHFLDRLSFCFSQQDAVVRFDQERGVIGTSHYGSGIDAGSTEKTDGYHEQASFIQESLDRLHSACAVVVTAPRGRGKSAALGLIAKQWLANGGILLLTAPSANALSSVYNWGELSNEEVPYQLPIDLLNAPHSKGSRDKSLLIIDEAAAIPVTILLGLVRQYHRVILSTTTDGYEGTGQGFRLRFLDRLETVNTVYQYELQHPIRWADSDRLEPLLNHLLLMNASSQDAEALADSPQMLDQDPITMKVDANWLVEHPEVMTSLFALLTDAHYRTTPGDFRILLDSPNVLMWIVVKGSQVLGACLAAEEGPLPDDLVTAIWEGRRRPRGHLIPQLLIAQSGFKAAGRLRTLRVIRIAARAEQRRQGYASGLLNEITLYATKAGYDLVGAAFSGTLDLYKFWASNGALPVRIGLQPDVVTGSYSLLVVKPLSDEACTQTNIWQHYMRSQLDYQSNDWLKGLSEGLYSKLQHPVKNVGLSDDSERQQSFYWSLVAGFAYHYRVYESTAYPLSVLLNYHLQSIREIGPCDKTAWRYSQLLTMRVLHQVSELEVIKAFKLTGHKMLIKTLREAAGWFIERAAPKDVKVVNKH